MVQYIENVFSIAFSGAWAIANSISFVLSILGGIYVWKRPPKEPIVKNLVWIIPSGVFIVVLIISLAIVTPYRIYQNQQEAITKLQNAQIQKAQDTKQEIRTFLESISPLILEKTDSGQKEIRVMISPTAGFKLSLLSKHPDFNKFLSFRDTLNFTMGAYTGQPIVNEDGSIPEVGRHSALEGYCLYPKDALKK